MRGCTCRGSILCDQCAYLAARAGVIPPRLDSSHQLSEGVFLRAVLRVAKEAGYLAYHTYRSTKSAEGYPDVTLVHPTRRELPVFLCEVKTDTGQVTLAQQAWVDALDGRTTVSAVWRPDDWTMIRRWLEGEDLC